MDLHCHEQVKSKAKGLAYGDERTVSRSAEASCELRAYRL
jgi:hypothetical protein